MTDRIFNFNPGPAVLPVDVLRQAADDLLDYQGVGMGLIEMSHRSREFMAITDNAESLLRKLMEIPDNYKVLFLQGGASSQFYMVPMNLLGGDKAATYLNTGTWAKKSIKEVGIAFLFAPIFHPAMKYVMPVRKELGFKTIFNILGPLTNPANTKKQLIGTFDNKTAELMCEASKHLDMERVTFVCTSDKYDEITLTGSSMMIEYDKVLGVRKSEVESEYFGYSFLKWNDLQGGSPKTNAEIILSLFSSEKITPQLQVVCANAAVALKTAGFSQDIIECKNRAEELVISGSVLKKLNELKSFCQTK